MSGDPEKDKAARASLDAFKQSVAPLAESADHFKLICDQIDFNAWLCNRARKQVLFSKRQPITERFLRGDLVIVRWIGSAYTVETRAAD